jgi:hypothetical protein
MIPPTAQATAAPATDVGGDVAVRLRAIPGGATQGRATRWPGRRRQRPGRHVLAGEEDGGYVADREPAAEGGQDDGHVPAPAERPVPMSSDLRAAVRTAAAALRAVRDLACDPREQPGELGALLELLPALDVGHAAAVALAGHLESADTAPRRTGLPLEGLLAFQSRLTFGDRRTLLSVGAALRTLPNLRAAFNDGAVGWAEVRAICAEARVLDAAGRARLDAGFLDHDLLRRTDPDRVVDDARAAIDRCRPDLARDRTLRQIEHRFLHVQPALDGALAGYFELDPEAGATLLAGLEAAMPPPSAGRRDASADALGEAAAPPSGEAERGVDARASVPPSTGRAQQRADGLVRLAESFLGGDSDGSRRPRPRVEVIADIATLTGHDELARDARLLWATVGTPPRLTPEAVRRLAGDADLRFLLTDGGAVLGVASPTPVIPASVRAAVRARDQGCRFPGCTVPVAWTDLHHVRPRAADGCTVVHNLVALCRRHHVAVTEGRWRLTMTADGVVTVRRGRRSATSDPPLAGRAPPGRGQGGAGHDGRDGAPDPAQDATPQPAPPLPRPPDLPF